MKCDSTHFEKKGGLWSWQCSCGLEGHGHETLQEAAKEATRHTVP